MSRRKTETTSTALALLDDGQLMISAQRGDADALALLKTRWSDVPDWQLKLASPMWHAVDSLIKTTAARNLFVAEVWEAHTKRFLHDLLAECGDTPSMLERSLCCRVTLCWLAVNIAEIEADGAVRGGSNIAWRAYYDQRLDRAHKRFLTATETLARVRRLLQPGPLVAQVNIAQAGAQQLNMGKATAALPGH